MEFLEEAAQVIQQTQQQTTKQPQSITYMTMDSFTEKAVVNPQQVTRELIERKFKSSNEIYKEIQISRVRTSRNKSTDTTYTGIQIRYFATFLACLSL